MNKASRTFFIEIYRKVAPFKIGFLAQTLNEARAYLQPLILDKTDSVIESLQKQAENPDKFPNIVIFLNEKMK
jgi:hypothetical protein